MKISLYIQVSDLIPAKKTLIEKMNNFFIKDPKHDMFRIQSTDYIFRSLKKAGVNGLELIFPPNPSDNTIKKIKEIIKKYNLSIFSIHQSNNNFYKIGISEIEKLCKIANDFSAKIIVLHVNALGKNIFNNNFVSDLKKLQEKYAVALGIENMPKSPLNFNETYTYKGDEFSSIINKTGLFITLDTTHLAQVNEDICDFYIKNKNKIINIHLSDYKKHWLNRNLLLANNTHLPLGKGELPMIKFLKILKRENYQGIITMEINSDIEGVCESAQFIKKAIGN